MSPFKRNIQTAIHLFKNHPNRKNINFVILPIVREVICAKDDINSDVYLIMQQYSEKNTYHKYGIKFDFSNIMQYESPQLWSVYVMGHEAHRKEILDEI